MKDEKVFVVVGVPGTQTILIIKVCQQLVKLQPTFLRIELL